MQDSQKCQQAYETFKNEATENGIKIDTSDIQTAEDELLTLSGEDLSTKFNVDVSDLNTALMLKDDKCMFVHLIDTQIKSGYLQDW